MLKRLKHWYYTRIKGYLCWNDMSIEEQSHFVWIIGHLHLFK
jgi:hypothetical protein